MLLGTLCGIATGVAMPIFMLIFGDILDEIGKGQGSFQDAINTLAMGMYVHGIAFKRSSDARFEATYKD